MAFEQRDGSWGHQAIMLLVARDLMGHFHGHHSKALRWKFSLPYLILPQAYGKRYCWRAHFTWEETETQRI